MQKEAYGFSESWQVAVRPTSEHLFQLLCSTEKFMPMHTRSVPRHSFCANCSKLFLFLAVNFCFLSLILALIIIFLLFFLLLLSLLLLLLTFRHFHFFDGRIWINAQLF